MKKILSFILAALMTASCAAFVAADDAAVEETTSNAVQDLAISFLEDKKIYKGGDGITDESPIERYQMALFVARVSTGWLDDDQWEDGTAYDATFKDVKDDEMVKNYLGAISYANQMGIIEGYSADTFGPRDGITYRDALTMVVRTLGYKGLSYPWGYIQKAVELGLTEDVTAAYTDDLTRGEVALILYNALFAETASGKTLAMSTFGWDYAWERIVITATDEGGFNNGILAKDGYVGFNVINDQGDIDTKTYYVDKKELGLENGHDDELALGHIYDALFTKTGDLTSLELYCPVDFSDVVENKGITDNEGKAATLPIADTLKAYAQVDKRYGDEYLTFLGQELYLYTMGTYTYYTDADKALVGIDANNNIVHWDAENGKWVIAWYYNETLDRYYELVYSEKGTEVEDATTLVAPNVYVNWMSDEEFTEWYETASKQANNVSQFVRDYDLAVTNPYAKLVMYDLDADKAGAEVAMFKEYKLANFANSTLKCTVSGHNTYMPTYKFTDLNGNVDEWFVEEGHVAHDTDKTNGFLWMNVADDVTGFANEDGTYNAGAVLYNRNKATGEVEIVKYIPTTGIGDDADSYFASGILQGYSTTKHTLIIDGKTYEYGYDKLPGVNTKMLIGDDKITTKAVAAAHLDGLLMQYVNFLVVDGKVVNIDAKNASNDVIVVYGYAGITSDNYIAVYGYSTADAILRIYKINSYNGWKQGDYRYYPTNATKDQAFELGTLYEIKSWDTDTNSYGVETIQIDGKFTGTNDTIVIDNGYRIVTIDGVAGNAVKTAASDTYIIILTDDQGNYVDLYSVSGSQLPATVGPLTGKLLPNTNANGTKFIINVTTTNAATAPEFFNNANDAGFVLYNAGKYNVVLDAYYDDAQVGIDDYYLLGSTLSTVNVYNILTGAYEYSVVSNNIDLVDGHVYKTLGGVIMQDLTSTADQALVDLGTNSANFVDVIDALYRWNENSEYAKFMVPNEDEDENGNSLVKTYTLTLDATKGVLADGEKIAVTVAEDLGMFTTNSATIKEKIADAAFANGVILREVSKDLKITDGAVAADKEYTAKVVYNVADKKLIVYIYAECTVTTGTEAKAMGTTAAEIESWDYTENDIEDEAFLKADWAGKYTTETVGTYKTVVSATIDEVALYFDVDKLESHSDIAKAGYAFGVIIDHDETTFGYNNTKVAVDVGADGVEKQYVITELTLDTYECKDCDMVNYVSVKGLNITLKDGDVAYVRFYIYGDSENTGKYEGNSIEVGVKLTMEDGKVVVKESENAHNINNNTNKLNSIDPTYIH